MRPRAATMPRRFLSSIMVMSELLMAKSIPFIFVKNQTDTQKTIHMRRIKMVHGGSVPQMGFKAWMKKVTDVDDVQGPLVLGSLLMLALLAYYAGAVSARRKPQACAAFDWRFERI